MTAQHSNDSSDEARSDERRIAFDPAADGEPSASIISAVAAVTKQDPVDMNPLADVVDTDALEIIVSANDAEPDLVHVSFTYEDTNVTVDSGGLLRVEPRRI